MRAHVCSLVAVVVLAAGVQLGCDDDGGATSSNLDGAAANTGGTGGGGGTGGTPATTDCDGIAQALCAAIARCVPLYSSALYTGMANCVERQKIDCLAGTGATQTGATPAKMAACIAAVNPASCGDIFDRNLTACDITGPRANGSACGDDAQCASGLCLLDEETCGVCSPKGALGSECGDDEHCQTGLICGQENEICVKPGKATDACDDENKPCGYGLFCNNGFCAATLAPGAQCDPDNSGCDLAKGNFCNSAARVCQIIQFVGPGVACGVINNSLVLCTGGDCAGFAPPLSWQGVCASKAADGTACGSSANGAACVEPARCINKICRLPAPNSCG